jgi:hypothetical protein
VPAAEGQDLVAFEADGYDELTRAGWSRPGQRPRLRVHEEPEIRCPSPWVSAEDCPFWIRIHPASISGRRTPDPGAGQER